MTESFFGLFREAFSDRKPPKIVQRQRTRLGDMVAFARANSPYYRELYRDLPKRVTVASLLPVTSKTELMSRFDDWATDREVTLEKARTFAENLDLIGERFLGKYTLATTSGTTGEPGIFILDDQTWTVVYAMALRMVRAWMGFGDLVRILAGGRRLAMTIAPGHTASAVVAARLLKSASGRNRVLPLSVHTPLPELVDQLNQFKPALLAPYASIAKLLAAEQEAGRLEIFPVLVAPTAEGLSLSEYDRIARAFQTKVRHSYAATECPFLSYSCEYGWLHVNSDWIVFEPVDADYRPVSPGQQSHTVLISNLANLVQPILRYDLGDSILERPDPCPCGNLLPAIRVQGRAANVLTFAKDGGERVTIPPLAFEVDHVPGVELIQIVQTSPTSLRIRLLVADGADPDRVWQAVQTELARLLSRHRLEYVSVERAAEPPQRSPGGKYRTVVPLADAI